MDQLPNKEGEKHGGPGTVKKAGAWGSHLGDERRHRLASALFELGHDGGVQQAVVDIRDLDAREEILDV